MAVDIHNDLLFFIQCDEAVEDIGIGQPPDLNKNPVQFDFFSSPSDFSL